MSVFFSWNFSKTIKYDLLRKSIVKKLKIHDILTLEKQKLAVSIRFQKKNQTTQKKKLTSFWTIELITLRKPFSKNVIQKLRKFFYVTKNITTSLTKFSQTLFYYHLLQNFVYYIENLKFFFNARKSFRNMTLSLKNSHLKQHPRIFNEIKTINLTLINKHFNLNVIWLSFYKLVL